MELKCLATNLALIAYYQGFNDTEMIEILQAFVRQYIKRVTKTYKANLIRQNSMENSQPCQIKRGQLQQQCSVTCTLKVPRRMHEIDWQSINTVANLMTLAEQLAIAIANLHRQPPISFFPTKDIEENNANHCTQTIQSALSLNIQQQQQLIDEIRLFAMNYAEIAERDHRLFFKHFRNVRIFQSVNTPTNITPIPHPLVDARRVQILIARGGIGGMATALNFARAGIRVRLLERNTEFVEVGAGMQLAPNCSRLLDRLGILEQV